jgi:two-component system, sensor histidine kinase PdtaS
MSDKCHCYIYRFSIILPLYFSRFMEILLLKSSTNIREMKILVLFTTMVCLFPAGYAQYIAGERIVLASEIPGLIKQLKNTVGQQRAELLLKIGYGHLYKDGENKADLDSSMLYAQQAVEYSTQIQHASFINESLLLTSMVYMEQKNMPAAKKMLPVLNDSNRLKMLICLGKFDLETQPSAPGGHTFLDSAAQSARAALKLALKLKKLQGETAFLLESIARGYSDQKFHNLAEKQYLLLLDYVDSTGFSAKARVLSWLSRTYTDQGHFYKATNFGIDAEKALNTNSSDADFALVHMNLGNLFSLQEKPEQAVLYFGNLLADPQKYRPFLGMYAIANTYCNNLRKIKPAEEVLPYIQKFKQQCPIGSDYDRSYYHLMLANAYREMKQFGSAEKNYLESIRYGKIAKIPTAGVSLNLGILYNQFNEHEKALGVLNAAEHGWVSEPILANGFLYISRSEAALGNYGQAYDYLLKSKTISDSIFAVNKAKLTQELEVQYQTQKKEADLRIKEENILFLHQRAELIRTVTILIVALLAVIIGLLFWLFRAKLKSNRLITHKNELLQQLVKDKSWLLKEMHHRVKNNLHTIMNLLEFQSVYLHDDALDAIRNSQSRIFSMSLIHQKLYQSDDDAKTIDMASYIPELVAYLKDCFGRRQNLHVNIHMDRSVICYVEDAVPLGLIINEAVTNSMKYAFKNDQNGKIDITLRATGTDKYELIIADNGTGLSKDFNLDTATTLGFQLIKGLSEQLEAQLQVINEDGLKIILSGIAVHRTSKVKTKL